MYCKVEAGRALRMHEVSLDPNEIALPSSDIFLRTLLRS